MASLKHKVFNAFSTILYMYMFRAISCSSSGGQIVLTQHLVSSLSVSDRQVHRCAIVSKVEAVLVHSPLSCFEGKWTGDGESSVHCMAMNGSPNTNHSFHSKESVIGTH
jgi:hypothetical protein